MRPSGSATSERATAPGEPPLRLLRRVDSGDEAVPMRSEPAAPWRLSLALVLVQDSGWPVDDVTAAVRSALTILGQCGIRADRVVMHEFDAPPSYRVLWTPSSRQFARRAALSRPAIFFVADTCNRPAFDAEAVGRANARTRPEMADTVWIVAGTRDLPVVIAHELAHVLADSGAHSERPGNLMRAETAAENTALSAGQCSAIVETAQAHGLLRRSNSGR